MPPKPQVFKSPDGKEFSTRAEWRDYMMATFYSYKDKKNLTEPLIKKPGEIDGQMFDIGDCENSTLVIMDNCEQVQIDQVKNCRIFIGACASSIFIRNCENCVFYTSCRQLRLREVQNSVFYIYSMSEVHIEESTSLQFAPFNGGYPEHSNHLRGANLDPLHNLWYDIFDHNDPGKSKKNWKLLPVDEYEKPWFPAGVPCELAVQLTAAGSVARADQGPGTAASTEQAFSIQQMMADAEAMKSPPLPPVIAGAVPLALAKAVSTSSGSKPSDPSGEITSNAATSAAEQMVVESSGTSQASNLVFSENNLEVVAAIVAYANFTTAEDLLKIASDDFSCIQPTGDTVSRADITAVFSPTRLWEIEKIEVCTYGNFAWAVFWISLDSELSVLKKTTAIFVKKGSDWKIAHAHSSQSCTLEAAMASLAASQKL